ncbi:hypothetical protein PTRG_04506 [Pyrenophora tritici-repentis Pt-1C-BFP]|uniref:Uncharacterized protein n=1 Tax=Pyrenophora tritici-repentis (strain Pt-1C-BFP) TaxID=426418 RepID=B2W4F6_PYRTR|nr:uncharacterized protein PTRG_04506 [Pyrenophora tritici-repentis Pt-1C-BFP]EDU47413.1 hypothetical protein PTRG_04506 [Pyrenophora tritici-repentis Pt-1C-BFP]
MRPSVRTPIRHLGLSCQGPHHLAYGADLPNQLLPSSNFRPGRSALAAGLGLVGSSNTSAKRSQETVHRSLDLNAFLIQCLLGQCVE